MHLSSLNSFTKLHFKPKTFSQNLQLKYVGDLRRLWKGAFQSQPLLMTFSTPQWSNYVEKVKKKKKKLVECVRFKQASALRDILVATPKKGVKKSQIVRYYGKDSIQSVKTCQIRRFENTNGSLKRLHGLFFYWFDVYTDFLGWKKKKWFDDYF